MDEGQWVAYCLDLNLAAQSDTFKDAKIRLEAQIRGYVADLNGVDKAHAEYLLSRRAPLNLWARYYFAKVANALSGGLSKLPRLKPFSEPMPLKHAHCR